MKDYAAQSDPSRAKPRRSIGALDSALADLDPDAHPIICRHWFGLDPLRPIGHVAAEVVAGLRRQRQIEHVHRLGPRAVAELLCEVSEAEDLDRALDAYERLTPDLLKALGMTSLHIPDSQGGPQEPAENLTPKPSDKEEKPRSRRKRDKEAEVKLRNKIEGVRAKALSIWKNPKTRPPDKAMAKHLAEKHGKKLGYKFSAIHQILIGTYPASKDLGIGRS